MGLFFITTDILSDAGRPFLLSIETDHASIEDVTKHLSAGNFLFGNKLAFVDDGRGGKLITGREPIGLNPDRISTIAPPKYRLWEPAEEEAA